MGLGGVIKEWSWLQQAASDPGLKNVKCNNCILYLKIQTKNESNVRMHVRKRCPLLLKCNKLFCPRVKTKNLEINVLQSSKKIEQLLCCDWNMMDARKYTWHSLLTVIMCGILVEQLFIAMMTSLHLTQVLSSFYVAQETSPLTI